MFACPRMVNFNSLDRPLKSALPPTFPLTFRLFPPLHSISLPHLIQSPIPSNSIPFLFSYPSLPLPITYLQVSFSSCSSPLSSNLPSIPFLSFSFTSSLSSPPHFLPAPVHFPFLLTHLF